MSGADHRVFSEIFSQAAQRHIGTGLGANVPPAAIVDFALESDASTVWIDASGIAHSRVLATWQMETDGFVLNGGHIEMRYFDETVFLASSGAPPYYPPPPGWTGPLPSWTACPTILPSVDSVFLQNLVDGESQAIPILGEIPFLGTLFRSRDEPPRQMPGLPLE